MLTYLLSKMKDIELFLSNRDFWLKFIFPIIIAWGILPYINESNADVLSHQAVALVQLIVPFIASLLLAFSKTQTGANLDDLIDKLLDKMNG